MVIDWRAPVSQPFYRASKTDPQDIALRRRFGYTGGELTAYEDEHLSDPAEGAAVSKLLQQEIERPRVGPMRDIVATIQPEQDEIVRSGLSGSVCVQGGPGTGKTAVGLHRVAYLLYAHRDRLARTGTLVIGPNRSFLQYIEQVLPALGELEVKQATVDDLVAQGGLEVRGTDAAETAVVKGDARMAQVLRRALESHVTQPAEALMVVRGSRRWRVPSYELAEMVQELQDRDIRYGAARDALPQRIAHAVLVRMEQAGEAPDDRVQDAVARNPAVKAAVKEIWPPVEPAKLVLRLLSDPDFLALHARDVLTADEQKLLLWAKPPRTVKSAKWSAADLVLIDEAADLVERTHSLGHVVLDEAQDLSPMQYRAVGRRCTTGSATVLGDLAQGTTPWATRSWDEALTHLGKPQAVLEELTAGFRVPREVIAYASRLLPSISPGLAPVSSVRETPGSLVVTPTADLTASVVSACRASLAHEGSIGLIAADARIPVLADALLEAGLPYLSPGEETTAAARLTLVAGLAGQGSGVRLRGPGRARGDRGRRAGRAHGPAPPVRLPHPRRLGPDGPPLGPLRRRPCPDPRPPERPVRPGRPATRRRPPPTPAAPTRRDGPRRRCGTRRCPRRAAPAGARGSGRRRPGSAPRTPARRSAPPPRGAPPGPRRHAAAEPAVR